MVELKFTLPRDLIEKVIETCGTNDKDDKCGVEINEEYIRKTAENDNYTIHGDGYTVNVKKVLIDKVYEKIKNHKCDRLKVVITREHGEWCASFICGGYNNGYGINVICLSDKTSDCMLYIEKSDGENVSRFYELMREFLWFRDTNQFNSIEFIDKEFRNSDYEYLFKNKPRMTDEEIIDTYIASAFKDGASNKVQKIVNKFKDYLKDNKEM